MLILVLFLVALFVVVTLVRIRCDPADSRYMASLSVPWSACCRRFQQCRDLVAQRWRDGEYPEYWRNWQRPLDYARDVDRDVHFRERLGTLAQRGQTWARDVSERAANFVDRAYRASS